MVKNPPASAGDMGSIPGSGKFPGEGNGNPLQCSCLGNPTDRGAWRAVVHGVTKSHSRAAERQQQQVLLHVVGSIGTKASGTNCPSAFITPLLCKVVSISLPFLEKEQSGLNLIP